MEEEYRCVDKDCDGELEPTKVMYMSHPPKYQYVCKKCGKVRVLSMLVHFTPHEW